MSTPHTTLNRYIADRFLPDKAIDIMDEAGSRVRITAYFARASSNGDGAMDPIAWEELKQVMDAKDEAIKDGLFEEAMLLRSRENELKAKLAGPADAAPVIPVVTTRDIESIVSAWTGEWVQWVVMGQHNNGAIRTCVGIWCTCCTWSIVV